MPVLKSLYQFKFIIQQTARNPMEKGSNEVLERKERSVVIRGKNKGFHLLKHTQKVLLHHTSWVVFVFSISQHLVKDRGQFDCLQSIPV